ncbi:MAG: hypothetical protein CR217_02605 [Beijerinckiaceae bacterium]|nr:MAG: hypothetical protein CR217_02605 [Beijerinckiaceae bacterium]
MRTTTTASADWVGSTRTKLLAWGLPHAALVAGLLVVVPARTAIWIVALAWMGVACILNARRCGRTHCRFTGPYYLVMIVPVLALGSGIVPAGLLGWLVLGAVIILLSKTIWWATERARGKFS